MDENSKKNLARYAILVALASVMAALLVVSSIFSRGSWRRGLSAEVQSVLDRSGLDYSVGEFLEQKSLMSTSSAVYRISGGAGEEGLAVIVRVPSLIGPVPAVFVSVSGDFEFVGAAGEYGGASPLLDYRLSSGIIDYWRKVLPVLVSDAFSEEEK